MEEKKEFKLFREKSLETIESPESMNDYLQVTSPSDCSPAASMRISSFLPPT